MLALVRRLVAGRTAVSLIVRSYGSFAAFESRADAQMEDGVLDPQDFPVVVICLARWEQDAAGIVRL